MSTAENPAAFPYAVPVEFHAAETGMTLRDWFAGQAMAGLHGVPIDIHEAESVARRAYLMATAMLAERSKP